MSKPVKYIRYYFPNGLRWTLSVVLFPLSNYLLSIFWVGLAITCWVVAFALWSFKYVTSIDASKKEIKDVFYRMGIPFGSTYPFRELNSLVVTRENKKYKAATRSRDYWVNYIEYSLHLKYDSDKELMLFTINDPDTFKKQVERFAEELRLSVVQTN